MDRLLALWRDLVLARWALAAGAVGSLAWTVALILRSVDSSAAGPVAILGAGGVGFGLAVLLWLGRRAGARRLALGLAALAVALAFAPVVWLGSALLAWLWSLLLGALLACALAVTLLGALRHLKARTAGGL